MKFIRFFADSIKIIKYIFFKFYINKANEQKFPLFF